MDTEVLTDKIHISGQDLRICANHQYHDWTVREYRKNGIFFNDKFYVLERSTSISRKEFSYEFLECDPEKGNFGNVYTYDETYANKNLKDLKREKFGFILDLIALFAMPALFWFALVRREKEIRCSRNLSFN